METNIRFASYLAEFCPECELFLTKIIEEIKTHTLYTVFPPPPPKKRPFFFKVEKKRKS